MTSTTKYKINKHDISKLFFAAGLHDVEEITPLGAGEFNAVFSVKSDGKEHVIKIAPSADTPVMTLEQGMMASEVFWYEQIRANTPIRVPEVYHADFSRKIIPADWFIMEKLPGQQLDNADFSNVEKTDANTVTAKMAAYIHKLSNGKLGYVQNELFDNWYQAIHSMVKAVIADCNKKDRKTKRGSRLLALIEKHKAILEQAECTMVNFDLWPPNIICNRENDRMQYAWIDPERSFWGDRIMDFVCLEPMKPLKKKTISIEAYNLITDNLLKITNSEEIRYAVAQGYLALIFEVEKYYRYTPLHFGWWRNILFANIFYKAAFKCL